MTSTELAAQLAKHQHSSVVFMGRPFVRMPLCEFEAFKPHFTKSLNVLNAKENYRSKHWLRHVHAVVDGDQVQFHLDWGNYSVFWPLWCVHVCFDVIPYVLVCLFRRKNPYNLII